jgi:MFS family permease
MADERAYPNRITALHLFLFSYSATLFMIVLLKLLSLHRLHSIFLVNTLFMELPLGSLLAARFFRPDRRSFAAALCFLQAAIPAALAAYYGYAHFWATHLYPQAAEANLTFLLRDQAIVALLFSPFFVSYGMAEFIGYRLRGGSLPERFPLNYVVFLAGALAAWGSSACLLTHVGLVRLTLSALLAQFLLSWLLRDEEKTGLFLPMGAAACLIMMAVPNPDRAFVNSIANLTDRLTARYQLSERATRIYSGFTRHGYLELIWDPGSKKLCGCYDGYGEWCNDPAWQSDTESLPFYLTKPGAAVSVIGAGGGRQVMMALEHRAGRVAAIDVNADLIRLLSGELSGYVHGIYNAPKVEVHALDGRKFHERDERRYDLIYLPGTGTFVSFFLTVLEASHALYTAESFDLLKSRLAPRGILAVREPVVLRPKTRQIFSTMTSAGLRPVYLRDATHGLIIGGTDRELRPKIARLIRAHPEWGRLVHDPKEEASFLEEAASLTGARARFFPFVSSYALLALPLALGAILLFFALAAKTKPARALGWSLAGLMIGLNAVALQNMVIFNLARLLPDAVDAGILGIMFSLACACVGSLLAATRRWRTGVILSLPAAVLLLSGCSGDSIPRALGLLAPLAISAGAFFPLVFAGDEGKLLALFLFDAIGSSLGAVLTLVLLNSFGLIASCAVTVGIFLICAMAVFLNIGRGPARA